MIQIVTKDGKDYLKTCILKIDSEHIEVSKFFNDLEELKNSISLENNEDYSKYGGSIVGILKRFSATYFSPSFMKSYMTNPANTLFGSFAKEDKNDATAIGTTVHKILELYYSQDKELRDRNQLNDLLNACIIPGQDIKKIQGYIDGYKESKDYLNEGNILDDKQLDCWCEYRGKTDVYIPKFNLSLPMPLSYVVDRIDLRGDKLYIIDYKTGYQTIKSATFDGYLGSMLLYKWVVEQDFGITVDKGFLSTPGNKEKYIPLDFSLVNESKLVEQVNTFCEMFKADMNSKILKFTNQGYFNTGDLKMYRTIMTKDNEPAEFEVEVYIGEHENSTITGEVKENTDGTI